MSKNLQISTAGAQPRKLSHPIGMAMAISILGLMPSKSLALPDLIVQSIVPSVTNPDPGQHFQTTVTVRNQGSSAAGAFYLLVDSDLASAPVMGTCISENWQFFDHLNANTSAAVSFETWYTAGGSHTFWARVDGCSVISETNEDNNRLSRTISVGKPDLVVDLISTPPEGYLPLGQTCTLSALIRNAGIGDSAACSVKIFKNSDVEPVNSCAADLSIALPAMAHGTSRIVTFDVRYDTVSNPRLWVWADGCGAIAESAEWNNNRSRQLFARRGPDLKVLMFRTTPKTPLVGQIDHVDVIVGNSGDWPTPLNKPIRVAAFSDAYSEPNDPCNTAFSTLTVPFPQGQQQLLNQQASGVVFDVTYHSFGEHYFRAVVDPCNTIREEDKANNSHRWEISVLQN